MRVRWCACSPGLTLRSRSGAENTKARFGLVTIANKAEAIFVPELQKLMGEVLQ